MICKKLSFLAGLTLWVLVSGYGQIVTSVRNGVWNEPSTWSGEVIPNPENASQIIINHKITLTSGAVAVRQLEINDSLILASGTTLDVLPDPKIATELRVGTRGVLLVLGTLIGRDSAVISGTSAANTHFSAGAVYRHLWGSKGYIPNAQWHPQSTLQIAGFKGSGYIAIAYSDSWKQTFGNVVYDCPGQTSFVDLNGYLRNIAGDLIIRNTNAQALRLSTTQDAIIKVGGSVIVEGPSEVWCSTQSDSTVMTIGKDLLYHSTSSGPSYFTTRGIIWITISGKFEMNTPGAFRMSSGTDDTAPRRTTLNLYGGLYLLRGSLIAPAPGKGIIVFKGLAEQSVTSTAASFNGNFDFMVEKDARVSLGNSVLANTAGALHVKGLLKVGSTDPGGAIQLTNKGNIQTHGRRVYHPGSSIEYNGTQGQFIGNGHPQNSAVNFVGSNPTRIALLQDIMLKEFTLWKGVFDTQDFSVTAYGDITVAPGSTFNAGVSTVRLSGNDDQYITMPGVTLNNLTLHKTDRSSVALSSALNLKGVLSIETENTILKSNGYLTLCSVSDDPLGTASVGPLPAGSLITGNVTVQRHMQGEGRIYRYISSPVANATIASLMDDFSITGLFKDPSTGKGIKSKTPSFFYYTESAGNLQDGWKPYPTNGLSKDNLLTVGKGYSAFIREAAQSTLWDVTGLLNQGNIILPIQYTANAQADTKGWNLLGNPYACTIDWDKPEGWVKSDSLSTAIAVRDNGEGVFRYWDGEIGDLHDGLISQGQSFWVRATKVNPILEINEQAKVTAGATFYREKNIKASVDYLEVIITDTTVADRAYIRIKAGAKEAADGFDALKFSNDFLSLSILTPLQDKLAISAVSEIDCEKQFPLWLEFARDTEGNLIRSPRGNYTLSIQANGLFENSQVTIFDKYTTKWINVSSSPGYEFIITDSPDSYAPDRFLVLVGSVLPDPMITVESAPYLCASSDYSIRLINPQQGIVYSLIVNDKIVEGKITHEENNVIMTIDRHTFVKGEVNEIILRASSLCGVADIYIGKRQYEVPGEVTVLQNKRCLSGPVALAVKGAPHAGYYHWYISAESTTPIEGQHDSVYITPVLEKSRSYYVSAITSSGCAGAPTEIIATVIQYEKLIVTFKDEELVSGYSEGNQWFLNNEILPGDTGQILKPVRAGVYRAAVDVQGCIMQAEYEYIPPLAIDEEKEDQIRIWPVPFTKELKIKVLNGKEIETVELLSVTGQVLETITMNVWNENYSLNTNNLHAGIYILYVRINGEDHFYKVLK